jgi:hypothetical protein
VAPQMFAGLCRLLQSSTGAAALVGEGLAGWGPCRQRCSVLGCAGLSPAPGRGGGRGMVFDELTHAIASCIPAHLQTRSCTSCWRR